MEREAFRQRMQQYKQAREQNPQLKYWEWKKYADGGTIYKKSTEMSPNELWLNVLQHENYNSYLPFSERIDVLDKIQQHDAVIDKYRNYSKKVEANPEVAKIVYKPLPKTLEKRWELAEEYKIPFISDKQIKLSKGRFNTGITSENVLDSIYNSANRTGVSFRDAIGLAGRESGLGYARNFKNKGYITGSDLYSNWGQIETIHNTNSAVDRYKKLLSDYDKGIKISEQDVEFMNKFRNNAEKEYESLRPLNENPIDNALKLFQSGKYNPGDPRHTKMVQNDGDVLLTDPAIKSWAKKRGIKLYSTGGTVDEDPPSTSERPIVNFDPKGDPYKPVYGYNPGAGYVANSDPLGSLYVEGAVLNPVFKLVSNTVSNIASWNLPNPVIKQLDAKAKMQAKDAAQIKKAIRSLPKDMKSIEAAYLQFATPGQYTKWFNKIPLLGTYPIVNKQFQNYEEDKDKARE